MRKPGPPAQGPLDAANQPQDPQWAKTAAGKYRRLVHLDTAPLKGVSAVFILWHSGMRPRWVYVGRTNDLAAALEDAAANGDIMQYDVHGGLFVTWSLIRDQMQDGAVAYLTQALQPLVANPKAPARGARPIPVLVPGIKR